MTDEEYVAAIEKGVRVTRARAAEFNAIAQQGLDFEPVSDMVTVTFDSDGYLKDLVIDPTAPTRYTHTELEELITTVLRESTLRLRDAALAALDLYFGADSSWQDLVSLSDES